MTEALLDRALRRVERTTEGCWLWTGAKMHGYGYIGRGRRGDGTVRAHKAVYEALVGSVAPGHVLHHSCGNKSCVNPEHLVVLSSQSEHRRLHAELERGGARVED